MFTEVLLIVLAVLLVALLVMQWRRGGTDNSALLGEVERLRAKAESEARELSVKAQEEASRTLEAARREAKELLDIARRETEAARQEARALRERAETEGERIRREGEAQVEKRIQDERSRLFDELGRDRERLEREWENIRTEREEMKRQDERIVRRGELLDSRALRLDETEERLDLYERELRQQEQVIAGQEREVGLRLERVSGLSREQAKALILEKLDGELEEEKAIRIKVAMERTRAEVKRQAQQLIAQAVQRQASETAAQLAVSVVPIPSDAMKGRIIGREGRNIRTFESLTGVDLIIDDTPEAVILSSFNPLRREVAKMALEQLVTDGRIHPSRIEEVVEKAKDEMKHFIYERGEEASLEAGVIGLKPGLVQIMGRMHFRSSYGQNVLKHSIQVAHLSGILAAELGFDPAMGRRAGLLHDVGKSVDREIEGTHVEIGVALGRRFGEAREVIDAIAHHHDPENGETVYSVLVSAADAISAARPGARRESLEEYIKRLEQLEQVALSFPGVDQAFAVQAGREVRVIVKPEKVGDARAVLMAHEIAGRIERDIEYPGQVEVTVIRETRAVEYAK